MEAMSHKISSHKLHMFYVFISPQDTGDRRRTTHESTRESMENQIPCCVCWRHAGTCCIAMPTPATSNKISSCKLHMFYVLISLQDKGERRRTMHKNVSKFNAELNAKNYFDGDMPQQVVSMPSPSMSNKIISSKLHMYYCLLSLQDKRDRRTISIGGYMHDMYEPDNVILGTGYHAYNGITLMHGHMVRFLDAHLEI